MRSILIGLVIVAFSLFISVVVHANCGKCGEGGNEKAKEEKITLDQCPEKVQETIKKEAGDGKIGEIEKITKGETITYEAEITVDGNEFDIVVDSEGKLLKKEADEEKDGKDDDGNDDDED